MSDNVPAPKPGFLPNNFYDFVKWCALIAFPAIGALYYGLASIWGLPAADNVVGSIVVIDTFLGVLVGISKATYDKSDARFGGVVTLTPDTENDATNMHTSIDTKALATQQEIVLKVNRL